MSDELEKKELENQNPASKEINNNNNGIDYKEEAQYLGDTIKKLKSGEDNTVKEFLKLDTKEKAKITSAYALLTQIAIQVIVIMGMTFFLGLWLDKKLGTSPWFLLIFLLLGMASAFKSIYDIGMNQVKKFERHDKIYKSYRKYNVYDDDSDEDDKKENDKKEDDKKDKEDDISSDL